MHLRSILLRRLSHYLVSSTQRGPGSVLPWERDETRDERKVNIQSSSYGRMGRVLLLAAAAVLAAANDAFGRRQGKPHALRDAGAVAGAAAAGAKDDDDSVEGMARAVIARNRARVPALPAGATFKWVASSKAPGEKIRGTLLPDGRAVFLLTFQTEASTGPGFYLCLASALQYGIMPHVLWWKGLYGGMITKVYAFRDFVAEYALAPTDVVIFIDGRDSLMTGPIEQLVAPFDATGEDFFWSADGGCIPGFCDYNRREQYPPAHYKDFPKFRYLNSGSFIGKAGFVKRYFTRLPAEFDKVGTDIDQGVISTAYMDGHLGTGDMKGYKVQIDVKAQYFVTAWFVPLKVVRDCGAAVIHFNGGFNVGSEADKGQNKDGLMMRVSASYYLPVHKALGRIMDQKVTLQGVAGDGVTFAKLRGDCTIEPRDLDSDMLHANCAPDKDGNRPDGKCKVKYFKTLAAHPQRQAFAEREYMGWLDGRFSKGGPNRPYTQVLNTDCAAQA